MKRKSPGYGDFGNLSKDYDEARQGFPGEVIQFFWTLVENQSPMILDIGCGTGIATRQLLRPNARILGSDKDAEMVKLARENGGQEISYVVAEANHQPFKDEEFDAIVAFSAFHWFSDKGSISEIRRILKRGGLFFIANKSDTGDFKKGYKVLLTPFIQGELPDVKKDYNPAEILRDNKFSNVQERAFSTSEFFTLSQATAYLQSVSVWNLVPENKKQGALKSIENYCEEKLMDGKIERKLNILTVVGRR